MSEVRLIDSEKLIEILCFGCTKYSGGICLNEFGRCAEYMIIKQMHTIDAEPVRHGQWIECDYKHIEHGVIEIEQNAGLCCTACRAAFLKKNMTYKQYCAACGARMK